MNTSMPLDDFDALRSAWKTLEQRLDRQQALNTRLLTESRLQRAKRGLWTVVVGQACQLLIGIAATLLFARIWVTHADDPVIVACGIVMHGWAILLTASAVLELVLVTRINYAQPVLVIQRNVALLRRWRTRVTPWLGIAFWVLWPVLVLLGLRVNGINPSGTFLAISFLLGVAGLVGTWIFSRWARRPERRHLGDALDRDHAGRALTRAQAMLDEIREFERE